jgi:hypothetical protein
MKFSFKHDFKYVLWKSTLWVNFLRSAAAGLFWCILFLFSKPISEALPMLAFPVVYFVIILPVGLVLYFLADYFEILLLPAALIAMGIYPGDTIIWIVRKIKPELVPTKEYSFINRALVLFVLDEEKMALEGKA